MQFAGWKEWNSAFQGIFLSMKKLWNVVQKVKQYKGIVMDGTKIKEFPIKINSMTTDHFLFFRERHLLVFGKDEEERK